MSEEPKIPPNNRLLAAAGMLPEATFPVEKMEKAIRPEPSGKKRDGEDEKAGRKRQKQAPVKLDPTELSRQIEADKATSDERTFLRESHYIRKDHSVALRYYRHKTGIPAKRVLEQLLEEWTQSEEFQRHLKDK